MSDEVIQFQCSCGSLLKAPRSHVGGKGKCNKCGTIVEIPNPESIPSIDAPLSAASDVLEVCSVCQTEIEEEDDRTTCGECGLPFHVECWEENLGCSAYGCKNVNALKAGPDISLGELTSTASPFGNPGFGTPQTAQSFPGQRPMGMQQQPAQNDIPWEYLLLAASALAAMLSIIMCGLPSLAVGIAAVIMPLRNPRIGWMIPGICIAISVLGVLIGGCLSLGFWGTQLAPIDS